MREDWRKRRANFSFHGPAFSKLIAALNRFHRRRQDCQIRLFDRLGGALGTAAVITEYSKELAKTDKLCCLKLDTIESEVEELLEGPDIRKRQGERDLPGWSFEVGGTGELELLGATKPNGGAKSGGLVTVGNQCFHSRLKKHASGFWVWNANSPMVPDAAAGTVAIKSFVIQAHPEVVVCGAALTSLALTDQVGKTEVEEFQKCAARCSHITSKRELAAFPGAALTVDNLRKLPEYKKSAAIERAGCIPGGFKTMDSFFNAIIRGWDASA